MPGVSDDELRAHLRQTLQGVDLSTTTEKKLRVQLEEHFGCDLKPKKKLFKEEIEQFLSQCSEIDGEDEEEDEGKGAPAKGKKRGGHTPQSLSEELQTFLGVGADADVSRGEVVKGIWAYIKEHDLQDPANKRKILRNDKLATLFTFPLNMFSLNKQISKHCKAAHNTMGGGDNDAERPAKKAKASGAKAKRADTKASEDGADGGKAPAKPSGFMLPQKLSPELAALVGAPSGTRSGVVKQLWVYIKEKELQNPANKQQILVRKDAALHKVLGVDECRGFSMSTHLKPHFLGRADAD